MLVVVDALEHRIGKKRGECARKNQTCDDDAPHAGQDCGRVCA